MELDLAKIEALAKKATPGSRFDLMAALDRETVLALVARARKAEELEKRDECAVCGAALVPDDEPPRCDDCPAPSKDAPALAGGKDGEG